MSNLEIRLNWKFLRSDSLMVSVYMGSATDPVDVSPPVPKRRIIFGLLRCKHAQTVDFQLTDHYQGPGIYSDSYTGKACTACARIVQLTRVW